MQLRELPFPCEKISLGIELVPPFQFAKTPEQIPLVLTCGRVFLELLDLFGEKRPDAGQFDLVISIARRFLGLDALHGTLHSGTGLPLADGHHGLTTDFRERNLLNDCAQHSKCRFERSAKRLLYHFPQRW